MSKMSLRPPHQLNQAYQLHPMECCFFAICIFIEPSQIHGPVPGWSPLFVTAVTDKGDHPNAGPCVCDGLIKMHIAMKQHSIGES